MKKWLVNSVKEHYKVPFTLPPEAVLKKLIHALESPRPKIRYYVTVPAYILPILKRLLPARAMDWILRRIAAGEIKGTSKKFEISKNVGWAKRANTKK